MATLIIEKILAADSKIQSGVFLQTREEIMADQATWDDDDGSKNTDFSGSLYWITTDDGCEPIGIDTDDELKEACPDCDFFA